jgi:cell division protein YceG involved in septum cleavage
LTTLILTSISLILVIMLYFNIVLEYHHSFFRSSTNLTRENRDNNNKREIFKGIFGSSLLSKLDNYKIFTKQ